MKLLSSGDRRASQLSSISVSAFVCFQPVPIAELDGTVSGDFFTVLCVGQSFTDDQWMNVYSFSMLRHWLLTYHSVSNSNTTADTGMTSTQTRSLLIMSKLHSTYKESQSIASEGLR